MNIKRGLFRLYILLWCAFASIGLLDQPQQLLIGVGLESVTQRYHRQCESFDVPGPNGTTLKLKTADCGPISGAERERSKREVSKFLMNYVLFPAAVLFALTLLLNCVNWILRGFKGGD